MMGGKRKGGKVGFGIRPGWEKRWEGMPEFTLKDISPWQSIKVHFKCQDDRDAFSKLIGQTLTDHTKSVWYPKAEIGRIAGRRYVTEERIDPRYPIYVISKGRWKSRLTAKSLEEMNVPYRIVVEPQERDQYAAVIDPAKILVLPFSNLGQGSIPARNWVWEHALGEGHRRHWILDDNIDGFYRFHDNLKLKVGTGATFRAIEDFSDRYLNIAMAGMNYFMFAKRKFVIPPFILNTRIYSCILLKNDVPHRWRGRYNEDTDLSLRILKDGLCTVLFNAFLALKQTTMTMHGGNTDELYQGDGRQLMAESLRDQHPDVVTITRKFDRWQHQVDYRPFRRNRLVSNPDAPVRRKDGYGMELKILKDIEKEAKRVG